MSKSETTAEQSEKLVPVSHVVYSLADVGLPEEVISLVAQVPLDQVKATLSVRRHFLTPEDEELANDLRTLARQAIREASFILEFGDTQSRLGIIRSLLSNTARLLGTADAGGSEEVRVAIDRILHSQKELDPEQEYHAVVGAASIRADDQDEEDR